MRIGKRDIHGVDDFFIFISLVLAIGTLILALKVSHNTDQIKINRAAHDKQVDYAIASSRHAAYRICVRQMVGRVAVNLDKDHDERTLPLYDCTPNLFGGAAIRLTAKQSRVYTEQIRRAPVNQLP